MGYQETVFGLSSPRSLRFVNDAQILATSIEGELDTRGNIWPRIRCGALWDAQRPRWNGDTKRYISKKDVNAPWMELFLGVAKQGTEL